jgi:hypothetical protein
MNSVVKITLFLGAFVLVGDFDASAEESRYSKAVRKACGADYHKYCGEYGIETAALRSCMDKHGQQLSKTCVRALVDAGEVSRAEVNRRKKSGR